MVIVAVNPQPISPSWSELEGIVSGDCIIPVQTPAQTLAWRKVLKPGNIMAPHTFCPWSAKCQVISHSLSGITYKPQTRVNNATTFIYLTEISANYPNHQFCFGHISIPESDWTRNKEFHIYYIRLYRRHSADTLQQGPKFDFYAEEDSLFCYTLQ